VIGKIMKVDESCSSLGGGELVEIAPGELVETFRFVVIPGSQLG